jgi:DNA-binding ferritin-like protein
MRDIIVYLSAIYGISKDLHYSASGNEFYSLHLMYDKISEDLLDYIDEIKENYYMARQFDVPTAKEINKETLEYMSGNSDILELHNLLTLCIYHIQQYINDNETLTEGDKSLLGEIQNDLNKKIGFINRTIKNIGE